MIMLEITRDQSRILQLVFQRLEVDVILTKDEIFEFFDGEYDTYEEIVLNFDNSADARFHAGGDLQTDVLEGICDNEDYVLYYYVEFFGLEKLIQILADELHLPLKQLLAEILFIIDHEAKNTATVRSNRHFFRQQREALLTKNKDLANTIRQNKKSIKSIETILDFEE